MKILTAALTLVISVALASPVVAQDKQPGRATEVPKGDLPPPGMCRIWIDGVPPNKQPASTDCATAVKNRPSNGRVIFGDDYAKSDKRKPSSLIKNFTDGGKDDGKRPDSAKPPVVPPRKPDKN
jgi:hypothetical protein